MNNFHAGSLTIALDGRGSFESIVIDNRDILLMKNTPLVRVGIAGKLYTPVSAQSDGGSLTVFFEDGLYAKLLIEEKQHSVTFEVTDISQKADVLLFGPVPTVLCETVGEVVGVARGQGLAFGGQALNIKTLSGVSPGYFEPLAGEFPYGEYAAGISVCHIEPCDCAAISVEGGSILQFCCHRRDFERYKTVVGVPDVYVPPMTGADASIAGAKLALFGCRAENALEQIGEIEQEEGLPHPLFDGEWAKTARGAMGSYLITDFAEDELDFILDKAEIAGFGYIYEGGPFRDWGHFVLNPECFPHGDDSMKAMAEKAARRGVKIGVHTLSNFLSYTDEYVTPVPSEHLLKQCTVKLLEDIDADCETVVLERSPFFEVPSTLSAVQLGDELILFGSAKLADDKTVLSDCMRGAFDTAALAHSAGSPTHKLWDYPYRTLFPDLFLQDAFCDRLVELFNNTGIGQISFDGLEGCSYTGEDEYAMNRFVERCYKGWDEEILNDASRLTHYLWHIHNRMNWGEPWGEEMREGQVTYRISNQEYFKRNLFPRMLGWFLLRVSSKKFEASTLLDLEWALSESAGFDAGYAITTDRATLRKHGQLDALLEAIKNWDTLRLADAFSPTLKETLRDPKTEWHLEKADDTRYLLYPLTVSKRYCCDLSEMQPGQTGGADWIWESPEERPAALRLRVTGEGKIENPSFATPKGMLKFLCTIEEEQYLLYGFDGKAVVTDKNFNTLYEAKTIGSLKLPKGNAAVSFSCAHERYDTPEVQVRFVTRGEATEVTLMKNDK